MNEEQHEVVDQLFWAFEYGVGYWFSGTLECDDPERHEGRWARCTACRWDGYDDETPRSVTFLTLLEGLKRLAAKDSTDWHELWQKWPDIARSTILALNGTPLEDTGDGTDWSDGDADWGDEVAQLGLFGEVVYG